MKRLVVVAVSLVVLAVATVSWLFWPRPPRPNLPDPSGRDGSRSSLHPRGGDALLTAKLPEPAGDGVLRGRVVDASGAPVAGATVTATTLPHDNPWQLPCDCVETCDATFGTCGCAHAAKHSVELLERREGEAIPVARTTTDADGRYELRGLAEDDFILWADHPTLGAAVAESPPGEQVAEDLHFGESAVHGQVFDESNRPLPDVRVAVIDGVHARFFETVTAEDGTFQFGPLPDHSRTVVVWDGLRLPVQLRLGPTELDLRVFLAPPRTVSGRVRLDDEPAVGVEVVASTEHLSRRVRAGPDGSFAFPGLPPDDYLLTVRKDLLLVERSVLLTGERDESGIVLKLLEGAAVSGQVVGPGGEPLAGAQIHLGGGFAFDAPIRSGKDGRFSAGPVAFGETSLLVLNEGFVEWRQVLDLEPGTTREVQVTLGRAASFSCLVTDDGDAPLADAFVDLVQLPESPELSTGDERSDALATGPDGRVDLATLPPGAYVMRIQHPGFPLHEQQVSLPGSYVVHLKAGLTLTGEAVDDRGERVTDARVRLEGEQQQGSKEAEVDGDGGFVVRGLLPGSYRASGSAGANYEYRARAKVELSGGRPAFLRLTFPRGGVIEGVVVDQLGAPVGGASVGGQVERDALDENGDPSEFYARADADEEGRFRLVGVLRPLKLSAQKYGFREGSSAGSVRPGSKGVTLQLSRAPRLRGRVVDGSGRPAPRYDLQLSTGFRDRFSLDDGRFELVLEESPTPLPLRLTVAAEGFALTFVDVPRSNEDVDLGDVVITSGRTLRGKVFDAVTGKGLRARVGVVGLQAELDVTWSFPFIPEEGSTLTRADGTFTLPLHDSSVGLVVEAAGYLPASQPLTPTSHEASLALRRGGRIFGNLVDARGKRLSGYVAARPVGPVAVADGEVREFDTRVEGGAFTIGDLPDGDYQVSFSSDELPDGGYLELSSPAPVSIRSASQVEVSLLPNGAGAGTNREGAETSQSP